VTSTPQLVVYVIVVAQRLLLLLLLLLLPRRSTPCRTLTLRDVYPRLILAPNGVRAFSAVGSLCVRTQNAYGQVRQINAGDILVLGKWNSARCVVG